MPRAHFAQAIRLDMVSVNVARAVGPAIAGVVIASWGVPPVFAINAACTLFLIVALLSLAAAPGECRPWRANDSCRRSARADGTYGTNPWCG